MLTGLSEAFSEPCKTPKMELSGKNIKVVLGMSAGLMEYSKTCETPKMEFLCKNIKIVLAMSGGLKMVLGSSVTAPLELSAVQIWRTEHVGTRRQAVVLNSGDFLLVMPSVLVKLTWSESLFKD